MNYITVKQTAEKWHVSPRWVQICCKRGEVAGAQRPGREWRIPDTAKKPESGNSSQPTQTPAPVRTPMPLLNSAFTPGKCKECIESFADADTRAIARAEYYYFSGQAERACEAAEQYLGSEDAALRLSAYLIYCYANLSLGRVHLSRRALTAVLESVKQNCQPDTPPQLRAASVFIANTASVLLHLSIPGIPPMAEALPALSPGLKFFACYIGAHNAYLNGDYSRSLGLSDAAFSLAGQLYPIPAIYLHLIAAIDYMSLKRPTEARAALYKAWRLAKKDDLIEAFGEHHGLLEGLLENCLKKDAPADFERIIAITNTFSTGWRQIHNLHSKEEVADNLTTTEFTIAMLANRGWGNKEIGAHLNLSVFTVKDYITVIYQKLCISTRNQLAKYMLR
ncbi:MAG: LuxR C-terminal-related transcriptional regulator [Oscillospiraceae bacterium]